jgi:SAM-dependent methyltransferase
MNTSSSKHYDDKYFSWQSSIGEFGGWANLTKFCDYIKANDNIIDFGCGGGYLLKNINCRDKIGIEVNPSARQQADRIGIKTYSSIDEVNDCWADLIISNNALEHCLHPLIELKNLYVKLKNGGRIVFVVPCESISYLYFPNDINQHLYSWSPMCIGNLFTQAGFIVEESKPYIHKWPPHYMQIAKIGGRLLFEICCKITGHLKSSWFQVRVIAHKP